MRQSLQKPPLTEATPLLRDVRQSGNYVTISVPEEDIDKNIINHYKDIDHRDNNVSSIKWQTIKAITQLIVIFVVSTACLYLLLDICLPPLDESKRDLLRLPKSFEDLKALNELLTDYKSLYYGKVLTAFFAVYIFLQTFSIPGSMWLSILGGALFGLPIAVFVVCICCALGSAFCYLLSLFYGKSLVRNYFSEKLDQLVAHMEKHNADLFNYIILLRLAPFPPNWFANLAAPHVGIPLSIFTLGTFFGVVGPSIIHVQAGLTINQMTSPEEFRIFTVGNVGALVLVACAVLMPIFIRRRVERTAVKDFDDNESMAPAQLQN